MSISKKKRPYLPLINSINESNHNNEDDGGNDDDKNNNNIIINDYNGESHRNSYAVNRLKFVLHGTTAKYTIVPKGDFGIEGFINDFFFNKDANFLPPKKPGAIISITGGAQLYEMHSLKLERVFNRGLVKAAQNIGAWIMDGGMDAGVMRHVGKAISHTAIKDIPCIGIASRQMVMLNEHLSSVPTNETYDYQPNSQNDSKYCALDPNHSHFVLVDSDAHKWGAEVAFASQLHEHIKKDNHIPIVLIVMNGGPVTLQLLADAVEKEIPAVVVAGTGRLSDVIAGFRKLAKKSSKPTTVAEMMAEAQRVNHDLAAWTAFKNEKDADPQIVERNMNKILARLGYVTVFDPNSEEIDMDIVILRAIIESHKLTLLKKLEYGVIWDREDIILETFNKELSTSTEATKDALDHALLQALVHNRPAIFTLLQERGAKAECTLTELYHFVA